MIKDHWATLPSKKSHYTYNKTQKNYFDHPLNVKVLYGLFKDYYKDKAEQDLEMKYNTYYKFFRSCNEYSFRSPKTDVCDFCTKCEVKLKVNPDDDCKEAYRNHLKKVQEYYKLKKMYIPSKNHPETFDKKVHEDSLVLEFDYAQNLSLPKLNINSHYYKRILNLYVFNIHCFNDNDSKMFTFLECDGKKDSNSVASFLEVFIKKKLVDNPTYKNVILFSDSAGGQNKNLTIVKFCTWLAQTYKIEVVQIFPVRGHSYCQCDRNFGLYGAILKKKPVIESPTEYLNVMKSARNNPKPFEAEFCDNLLKNWTKALSAVYKKTPILKGNKFSIQKYVKIKYNQNSQVFTYFLYDDKYIRFDNRSLRGIALDLEPVPKPGLTEDKTKDLQFFVPFLEDQNKNWLLSIISRQGNLESNEYLSEEESETE